MILKKILIFLLVTTGFCLVILPALAEEQVVDEVVYSNGFTTDPHWTTNSPRFYYWVPDKGVYHYAIEPSTGANAYVDVDYPGGAFTLDYDVTPVSTQENAAFRLAFSTKEMDRTKGTIVDTELANGKHGRLFWLRAVTPSNKLLEVSSQYFSYGEKTGSPTVLFSDNTTYHVSVKYDDERDVLTMRVSDKSAGKEVWSYFIDTKEDMTGMKRISIGTLGDYSNMGPVAEGYIDNVRLTVEKTVTVTSEATTAPTITTVIRTPTKLTVKPTTAIPVETTPASPLSPVSAVLAAGSASIAVWYFRKPA